MDGSPNIAAEELTGARLKVMILALEYTPEESGGVGTHAFELAPASSTNYDDETAIFTDDPVVVGAFKTKFDRLWNDTTIEPQSMAGGAPYLKNWNDACAKEPMGCDFFTQYPSPAPMIITPRAWRRTIRCRQT